MTSKVFVRAEVYATLAESLAEPPAWLSAAGRDWPLFEAVVCAARDDGSAAARLAVDALATIRPESLAARRRRYQRLFVGAGRPRLWLYESLYVAGRLLGPATLAVEQVYRAAGLKAEGAELPDHASLELAFLGWLAEQEAANPTQAFEWQKLTRSFIKQHAGRWLPDLGRSLAATSDPVYAPIGQLLADWLTEMSRPLHRRVKTGLRLPVIPRAEACTLCGFCAQVCPTRALSIRETDIETGLLLIPSTCVGCARSEQVCDLGAMQMGRPASTSPASPVALRVSSRSICPGCGQPTVSRVELETIATNLGYWPHWLDYCLVCRPMLMESV